MLKFLFGRNSNILLLVRSSLVVFMVVVRPNERLIVDLEDKNDCHLLREHVATVGIPYASCRVKFQGFLESEEKSTNKHVSGSG